MKPTGLDWLLEREDPPIRLFALTDILGRSPKSREVLETREQIRKYSPVRKVLAARTKEGYWPPKETCYAPKWTSTVWPLMLLGEMEFTPDQGVKRACETFLDLHPLGGALPHGQHDPDPVGVWIWRRQEGEEGDRLDARASARRWRLELQLSREEGEAQQLHVNNRTTLGLLRDSTCKV